MHPVRQETRRTATSPFLNSECCCVFYFATYLCCIVHSTTVLYSWTFVTNCVWFVSGWYIKTFSYPICQCLRQTSHKFMYCRRTSHLCWFLFRQPGHRNSKSFVSTKFLIDFDLGFRSKTWKFFGSFVTLGSWLFVNKVKLIEDLYTQVNFQRGILLKCILPYAWSQVDFLGTMQFNYNFFQGFSFFIFLEIESTGTDQLDKCQDTNNVEINSVNNKGKNGGKSTIKKLKKNCQQYLQKLYQ